MVVLSWGRVAGKMVSPWRHPKTGMLWFRRAVPAQLRLQVGELLGRPGKPAWELKWTLGTHELAEAKRLMPVAMEKAESLLKAARDGGARPLTEREAQALAGLWYRRRLHDWAKSPADFAQWDNWDVALPLGGDEPAEGDPADAPLDTNLKRSWAAFTAQFHPEVVELLAAEGVVTDAASKERVAELLAQRLSQARARQQKIDGGDYRPDPLRAQMPEWTPQQPSVALAAAPEAPAVSLDSLLSGWSSVAVVKPRTVAETTYAVAELKAFLGHDDARRITRDDLARWRDGMKAAGRTNNTWNNLSLIRQVLQHGLTEKVLTEDFSKGLRLKKTGRSLRFLTPTPRRRRYCSPRGGKAGHP
jgi:hypothetical protein